VANEKGYQMFPLGETAVHVSFGAAISPAIHKKVKSLADYVEGHPFPGFVESVASYTAVTVMYNPYQVVKSAGLSGPRAAYHAVCDRLEGYIEQARHLPEKDPDVVEIPVCYGGEYGPDLEHVAEYHHMTPDEVVQIHAGGEYLVYMIGFCPGFPYMGGMDERIATPRRENPRLAIPARSIGIAGLQTGGYPISTPGGWNLIGRSAVELFDSSKAQPSLLKAGDIVHFRAVTEEEYKAIRGDRHES
jgi:inhibitor of KinA